MGKMNGMSTIYDNRGHEIYTGTFVSDLPLKTEYINSCKQATFAQLEADTESYVNQNLKITGVVTDIAVQEDLTVLYIISIAGDDHKNICFNYIGEKGVSIREGDRMTFYGYCEGYRQFMSNSGARQGGMFIKAYYVD